MMTTANMNDDSAGSIISDNMTAIQIFVVAICIFMNALDGFDVLAIAFSAPAIAREWSLSPVALGSLFSAGLIGMAFGAFFLSPLADHIGRRRTVLVCLAILAVGMGASAASRTLWQLWILRCFTGLGIGAMLATINTLVAEYASPRRRSLCIALMSLGYPIGATAGAAIAAFLITAFSWHAVYAFGGLVALILIPAIAIKMPESLAFLMSRRGPTALQDVNDALRQFHRPPLTFLPVAPIATATGGYVEIASRRVRAATFMICLAFLGTMVTMFFAQSWTPKLLVGMGFSDVSGITGSMVMNLAGVVGCLTVGYLAAGFSLRLMGVLVMAGLFVGVVLFGFVPAETGPIVAVLALMGFCMYGSIAALYAMVAVVFPTTCRATGTGVALGVGRLGAIAGPYLAGLLIDAKWTRPSYCLVLALPMLISIVGMWMLGRRTSRGPAIGSVSHDPAMAPEATAR